MQYAILSYRVLLHNPLFKAYSRRRFIQADITMDGFIINTAVLYGAGYNGIPRATGMIFSTDNFLFILIYLPKFRFKFVEN